MNKTIFGLMIASTLSIGVVTVMAQSSTSSGNTSRSQANQATRMTNMKQRGDNEINRRVASLNALIPVINNMKKLPSASQSSLTANIQAQVTSLNNLKTKIDADTDINTLKADNQSIVNAFRTYLLFIPQTHIIASADVILQVIDSFNSIATKLQAKIQQAQAAGKDVSSLNASLADMQAKIADAKVQANNAISAVTPLQPGPDPTAFQPTLSSARTMLKTAYQDLQTARNDARSIIQGLKQMKVTTSTSSATQK